MILSGSLAVGDRLPSERQLVERLGVGRSAVREAISALEILGFLETRTGSGTYLRSVNAELLPQTMSWGMLMSREQTEHLCQVRAGLETTAIELATPRYDERACGELGRILDQTRRAVPHSAAFIEADMAFHRHIAHQSGNPMVADMLATARSLLRVWFDKSVSNPQDMDRALREHTMIFDAIQSGDSALASAAMKIHMVTATSRLLRHT